MEIMKNVTGGQQPSEGSFPNMGGKGEDVNNDEGPKIEEID